MERSGWESGYHFGSLRLPDFPRAKSAQIAGIALGGARGADLAAVMDELV